MSATDLTAADIDSAHFDSVLADAKATLERIAAEFSPAVFASSLAAEDMVLADLILRAKLPIKIFTLETGRLHAETLGMVDRIREVYGYDVALYKPEPAAVDAYVSANGLNAFYDSVEMRKECCRIRKVEPLNRAELAVQEDDAAHGMQKFNPLADWTEAEVWHYLKSNQVPYNPLHDKGYPSIGCEPCTRAIQPGEDVRAGRWWWENPESKECGLHVVDGKLVRIKSA